MLYLFFLVLFVKSDQKCDDCISFIISHIDDFINDNVRELLVTNTCKNISNITSNKDNYDEKCAHFVDLFISSTKSGITKMDPGALCKLIGKCSRRPRFVHHQKQQQQKIQEQKKFQRSLPKLSLLSQSADQPYPNCNYCKHVWGFLMGDGAATFAADIARDIAKDVCKQIPELVKFCELVDTEHSYRGVQMLIAKFTNDQLCEAGRLCPPT